MIVFDIVIVRLFSLVFFSARILTLYTYKVNTKYNITEMISASAMAWNYILAVCSDISDDNKLRRNKDYPKNKGLELNERHTTKMLKMNRLKKCFTFSLEKVSL